MKITPEMERALVAASKREDEFFARHGFSEYPKGMRESGIAPEPHRAWVRVVEMEYNQVPEPGRCFCDTPMARKMFTLGYLKGMNRVVQNEEEPPHV